ncbi:MAG: TIGR00159 family protein [Elusimicrobia bacterium RIFOXYA2_FULL_58_8]|nr:MAG: TIGR00159 family protein [Elusimicrobia bacterium RIFOXYA2_FULL_58_8]
MYLRYINNLVDIVAVYYIVYRLILLLKGTRAMQVVWGVFVLAVVTSLAKFLNLSATVWLMQQFWLAGIFLLIVVFQPEIRSALANIGSNPLGRIMVSQEYMFISEMIEALRLAAAEKMGMLIVLEQDMGLRDIVETGVRINGEVSKELLLTVFHDKTLLHDGAAVIANSRLVAAGCILPLTEQKELSKILGMRHRAALGLSEIADAIIVTVSEETGLISVARNGKLQQAVDTKDLEAMLYQLYRSKAEKNLLRKALRPEQAPPAAAAPAAPAAPAAHPPPQPSTPPQA